MKFREIPLTALQQVDLRGQQGRSQHPDQEHGAGPRPAQDQGQLRVPWLDLVTRGRQGCRQREGQVGAHLGQVPHLQQVDSRQLDSARYQDDAIILFNFLLWLSGWGS